MGECENENNKSETDSEKDEKQEEMKSGHGSVVGNCAPSWHVPKRWQDFELLESAGYVNIGGRYHSEKCNSCKRAFIKGKSSETQMTTTWNGANPGRKCRQCDEFVVCNTCYSYLTADKKTATKRVTRSRR